MQQLILQTTLCLLISIGFIACTSDSQSTTPAKPKYSKADLGHRWDVDRAFRNGKIAASLDGLFFDFTKADSVSTNLIGQDFIEPYSIEGDSIWTTGSAQLNFSIKKLDSTHLVLETTMRATPFAFHLKKAIPEEQIVQ